MCLVHIVGIKWGKHRIGKGRKTVEGSVASFLGNCVVYALLTKKTAICVFMLCEVWEGMFPDLNDNLFTPLLAFFLSLVINKQ